MYKIVLIHSKKFLHTRLNSNKPNRPFSETELLNLIELITLRAFLFELDSSNKITIKLQYLFDYQGLKDNIFENMINYFEYMQKEIKKNQ